MKKHFWIAMALLSLGVTSCKDDITFDQETYDNLVNKTFPVENVDPTHQWATVGKATGCITVNGDYGETYKVGLYLGHPVLSTSKQLYMGEVKSGETLDVSFSHPVATNVVYIGIFDKDGRRIYMNAPIENGHVDAVYGNSKASSRATEAEAPQYAKTLNDYLNLPAPNSWSTVKEVTIDEMKQYTAITDGIIVNETSQGNRTLTDKSWYYSPEDFPGHSDGKHFRIAKGTTITEKFHVNGTQNVYNDVVIYVEGTMHVNGNTLNGPTIVVADGGELIIDGNTSCTNAGRFIIMAGGKMTGADGVLWDNSNGSYCYNAGTIEFNGVLNLNGTNFYNNGTVNVDVLTGTAGDTKFTNFGKITANTNSYAGTTYNQTWVNACYVHFKKSAGLGSSVMLSGSRFDVDENCTPVAGTIDMSNQSEIKVGGYMFVNDVTFNGPQSAGQYAIVKMNSMLAYYEGGINSTGLVYFDFDPGEIYGMWSNPNKNYQDAGNDYQYTAAAGIVNNKIHYWVNEQNALNEITIPESCGGIAGFNSEGNEGDPVIPEPQQFSYRYCFEDNFPDVGDYDFNDVVMTVTPTLNDRTLTIKVSLDAVGATETIAAAMRLIGVKRTDLDSYTVTQGFASPDGQGLGEYTNINTTNTFLFENESPNDTKDMVIVLFKDAHWAINPVKSSGGMVQYMFYNTVKRDDPYEDKAYPTPATATYTLVFNDAEKAKNMLAENYYDVFIVEPFNGAYWEVHTVQNGFKTTQVFQPIKPDGYEQAYGSNKPWAIMVPGDFKYPNEWQVIGKSNGGVLTGAYQTAGHSFAEWAEDQSKATDWYLNPTKELVFE